MVAVFIMFYVVVAVCMIAVMRLPTDNIIFIPAIVVLVMQAVAITGLAVSWVKDCKKAKEMEDHEASQD